jgi:superoxide dismutase
MGLQRLSSPTSPLWISLSLPPVKPTLPRLSTTRRRRTTTTSFLRLWYTEFFCLIPVYRQVTDGIEQSPIPTKMPEEFLALIPWTWSSPEALKTEFLTTAKKMFGNGWVWLVLDQTKYLRIVCTYNAGTPYGAAYRRQETDMNTTPDLSIRETTNAVRNSSAAGANWAVPLLNINVWEHAWVEDFGVNGKEQYLEAVWNAIDWSVVSARFASTSARTLQH